MTRAKEVAPLQAWLLDVKVGDRIWIGDNSNRKRIETVSHRTPTLICTGNKYSNGTYSNTYRIKQGKRDKGYSAHQTGWRTGWIVSIATPDECAMYEAVQEQKRQESLAQETAEQQAADKRTELCGLFAANSITVRDAEWGERADREGRYDVHFHGLTEQQVRDLAKKAGQL